MITIGMTRIEDDGEMIQYIKTVKLLNRKNVSMLYRVHKGFDTIEDLKEYVAYKGIDYKHIAVIKFLNMYYAVAFEDYNRELMIGKNNYFYTNDNYILIQGNTQAKSFKPKFYPTFLYEKKYKHFQLYYDLEMIDENIDIFKEDVSIKESIYSKAYAIILGLTFCSFYIKRDELEILDYYFSDNYSDVFRDYPWVSGINPFKGKVRNERGGTRNHQFFKRNDRGPC